MLPMDRGEGQQWNRAPGNIFSTPKKVSIDPKQAEELKIAQEEALKNAEARKKAAAEAKANGETATPVAELTEEQRLKAEVDKLLRS